ncbi:MAG TPA: ABC transporter permease, partial [Methylophilus sp.]
ASMDDEVVSDARALKSKLRRAERMGQLRAYLFVLPLLIFLLLTFFLPIGNLLLKSVKDPLISEAMPRTVDLLGQWNSKKQDLPSGETFAALAHELAAMKGTDGAGKVALRLNFESPGMRSLVLKTARSVGSEADTDWRVRLPEIDSRWNESQTWVSLKYASKPWTMDFYLKAFDLTRDEHGAIVQMPEDQRLYRDIFLRTAWIGLVVSLLCVLFGYPVAYFLASLPTRLSNVLMILVLLPFWTSFLVRSISWMVVLQGNGILNGLLSFLGISDEGVTLIYNRWGVLISMTHILVPYAILSLYSVMKNISPVYMRAARSLGAGPVRSFFSAYFPHTLPGVAAGIMLTFILAVGYYITPAMLGGPDDQLVSYYIANHVNTSLNWGLAAALATLMLAGVMFMYVIFVRLTGGAGVKLG